MSYLEFAAEYRRLFALMVANNKENGTSAPHTIAKDKDYAAQMAELADKVPPEWVDRVEGMDATEMLLHPKPAEFWLKNPKEG